MALLLRLQLAIAATTFSTLPDSSKQLSQDYHWGDKYLFILLPVPEPLGYTPSISDGTLNELEDIEGLPKAAGLNDIAAL
jgi:hypothetical protein